MGVMFLNTVFSLFYWMFYKTVFPVFWKSSLFSDITTTHKV